jgi:signal transduction histidine kinase/PAS domain-containing protein
MRQGDFVSHEPSKPFEDAEQRAQAIFTPVVRAALVIGAISLLFVTPFIAINKSHSLAISAIILLASATAWLCMIRNRARLGAAIIVAAFWSMQTILLLLGTGGFIGNAYLFSTLLAGLALGTRAILIVGGLSTAVLVGTLIANLSGAALTMMSPAPFAARASFSIIVLLGCIWTLHVFIRRMENAFATAEHEIAERRRTEQDLQRRAEDLEEAQRLAQSGSWEYDVATGEHRWSRQHFRIHGLDPDTTQASFRVFIEHVPAEEQSAVAAAFHSVYEPPYYIRGEYRVLRAPGDMRTIDGRIESVRDESGKIVKLRGTSVDITERRRTEELRELELAVSRCLAGAEETEPAIRSAFAAICEHEDWEAGGYWCARESGGELHLEHWWVRPRFAEAAEPLIQDGRHNSYSSGVGLVGLAWRTGTGLWIPDVTKDERVSRVELLNTAGLRCAAIMPVTDGSRVAGVLAFSGLDVREPDGAFMQAFPVLGSLIGQFVQRKQTEQQRRALQAQLYQSQKLQALGTLAGGIAHEFNNMIAAIIGNASLASQDVGDNPAARESLDQITAAAERARALTRRILLFGRAQADTRTCMALAPLLEDAMRLLRATLPARITLIASKDGNIPPVRADSTQLHQLIVNLCTNAAHAIGGESGTIELSLTAVPSDRAPAQGAHLAAGEYVCLAVKDSGCGIEPQVRERIFEPFFTTKRAGEGAGLGLSVVHSIVQGHEGAIEVDSTPGSGTLFRVYLPAATAVGAPLAQAESAPDIDRSTAHIFYVDDDPTIVSAMERMLSRRGYRVSGFTSPRKALELLHESRDEPSLLVSDYNMAEMSGLDVARDALKTRANLPILIVSGFIEERVERAGRALGVREFVHKPDLQEMCAAIDRLAASA